MGGMAQEGKGEGVKEREKRTQIDNERERTTVYTSHKLSDKVFI